MVKAVTERLNYVTSNLFEGKASDFGAWSGLTKAHTNMVYHQLVLVSSGALAVGKYKVRIAVFDGDDQLEYTAYTGVDLEFDNSQSAVANFSGMIRGVHLEVDTALSASETISCVLSSSMEPFFFQPEKEQLRLDRYLDTNGDGTGSKEATGNYAGGEEIFYLQPPAGEVYILERMLVYIEDNGSFDSGKYGNNITLSNGIEIFVNGDSGVISDLTDGLPIITNAHWGRQCFDTALSTYGSGNQSLAIRWTFSKAGVPITLRGNQNERLEVVLNDNFSTLHDHAFLIQGYS